MFNTSKTPVNWCLTGKTPKPLAKQLRHALLGSSSVIVIVSFLKVVYPLKIPSICQIFSRKTFKSLYFYSAY